MTRYRYPFPWLKWRYGVGAKGSFFPLDATNDEVDLPVGDDGQLLTADSAADGGVSWQDPPSTGLADGDYGDIVISGSGTVFTIDTNAVTDAKFRQSAGVSVVGRSANSTGNVADITASADGKFLARRSAALTFDTLVAGDIPSLDASKITTGTMATARLGSGSASSSTFLRGDQTWAVPSGGLSSPVGPTDGGTGLTSYVLGDILYASAANVLSALAGNTTATKKFLRQTGTGSVSAAPAWDTLVAGDIPNLDASKITTGTLALARGGTNADLSASGSATAVLAQDGSHVISARALVAADIPSLAASIITSGTLALARGGTNADLSASGSSTAVLAQDASHVITARALVAADIPSLDAAKITTGTFAEARGGTNHSTYATGDILYASAANTLSKLAIGTTGKILSVVGGVPAWVPAAGATGSPVPTWVTQEPRALTGSDLDDYFDDTTGMSGPINGLTSWTWRNQGGASVAFNNHTVLLTCPANGAATNSLRGIERTVSGAFKFTARLGACNVADADFWEVGLWVINSSNGKVMTWGAARNGAAKTQVLKWTNVTTFSATALDLAPAPNFYQNLFMGWWQIESDGTTISFRSSITGVPGTFPTAFSETIATFIGTPDRVGLFANSAHATNTAAVLCEIAIGNS